MGLQVEQKHSNGLEESKYRGTSSSLLKRLALKNAKCLKKTGILHAIFNMVQGLQHRTSRGCREQTDGNPGHPKKIEATQPGVQMKGHHKQGLCVKWLWQGPNSSGAPNSLMLKSRTRHFHWRPAQDTPGQNLTSHTRPLRGHRSAILLP